MPLRSLTTVVPGGWRLSQTLPDGTVKSWASMNDIWSLAKEIADFRAGNDLPNATAKEVIHEIENQTCARLHDDPSWCSSSDKKKGVRAALTRLSKSPVGRVAAGGRVLIEWLGSGAKPVPIAIAQARANVCRSCPENREGHSFLKLTADTVRAIAEQMQEKNSLKLRVEGEEELHSCRICLCPISLKVHVPLATIQSHTTTETMSAFPSHCWIVTEQ
jgi:hypothetical protein